MKNFNRSLTSGCFSLHLQSDTKDGVIAEMVDLMVAAGKIQDRESALKAVLERERKMSTGMQCGVAVPHGKTPAVDELITAFALKPEGVDFDSMDGEPSRIFVMTVSSTNRTGPHMEYLAEIGRLLSSAVIRQRLIEAKSVDEIIAILTT